MRRFLDTLPGVEPLCWGAYGEVSEGVRRLVKSLALEMAKDSERCADFNCTGYEQAQGVIAWHFTRHFGRTSVITAAQVKIHQLQCVGGSRQRAAVAGQRPLAGTAGLCSWQPAAFAGYRTLSGTAGLGSWRPAACAGRRT